MMMQCVRLPLLQLTLIEIFIICSVLKPTRGRMNHYVIRFELKKNHYLKLVKSTKTIKIRNPATG